MIREKEIIKTSVVGILGNFVLVAAKATVGLIAGSISIILDAVNNLTDAISSIVTIIGTKLSNKKPDEKHPFGYGRIEYLISVAIAAIVLFAGGSAIYESIQTLIKQESSDYSYWTIIVVSIAIVGKILLGLYFRHKGKQVNSDALKDSGLDALFDAVLSASTLIGIVTSMVWGVSIEGYLGIIIGLFIVKSGIGILKNALSQIIGERTSAETANEVKKYVCSFKEVRGAYDLILNNYGPERAIGSVHIEVRDNMAVKEIHALTRGISEGVYAKFGIIMTIGIYAANDSNPLVSEIKKYLYSFTSDLKDVQQVHGFYLYEEKNLISFDLIVDFKCENVEELKTKIIDEMKSKYPNYDYYIVIDREFNE